MKKVIVTNSQDETFHFAMELGKKACAGDIFALFGDLGAGKTIVAKGIAKGMGIDEEITSPTFSLLEIYLGTLPLYHFDLYRIEQEEELDQLFFEEYWEGEGVSIIEWAERARLRLPSGTITLFIEYQNEQRRSITLEYPGN